MVKVLKLFALACVVHGSACTTTNHDFADLFVDPEQRGFEMPARPQIVFFVDGLREDVLADFHDRGELPRLSRYFLDRAARVRSAVTSVPSLTYANAVTMMTGHWPSRHRVWSNMWFDRDELLTRNYEEERDYADGDCASTTLFELMSQRLTAVVALPFRRSVKISLASSPDPEALPVWIAWAMKREEVTDVRLSEQLYEIGTDARAIGQWPDFILIHLPAVDKAGHDSGSDGEAYREAVANLDQAIGEVLETFHHCGMLDELTIVLLSDHGHHSAPHWLPLDEYLRELLGAPVLLAMENDAELSFVERWETYSQARVVVTINGAREASIHLRTSQSWSARPGFDEVLGFPTTFGGQPAESLPELLLRSPAVDLVAVRAGDDEVRIFGHHGAATIERVDTPSEPSFRYELLTGEDPLGYHADERLRTWMANGPHTSRQWLEATADQRRPDIVPQLVTAFDDPRSGDLILFAAPTWDFAEKYAGGHGGLEREEMIVPFYLAGPGIRPGVEIPAARLVDVVPTLLDLAGAAVPTSHEFDGISLAPMLSAAEPSSPAAP